MKTPDISGKKFGKLLVISRIGSRNGRAAWECLCECGKKWIVITGRLTSGHTTSCGCTVEHHNESHHKERKQTKEYGAWLGIKNRCLNTKYSRYRLWGGRGITMCDKWKNSYLSFLADMGRAPSRIHSIDRINNDGNYEPKNCRWATPKEQRYNQTIKVKKKAC